MLERFNVFEKISFICVKGLLECWRQENIPGC